MKSHKKLQQRLPQEFLDAVSEQYEPKDAQRIFNGFMEERPVTLRINRIKTDVRTVMERFRRDNIRFERVLWYEDALIIRNCREKDLESHELYQNGDIYLQSLSSMIPPLVVAPRLGSKVLDLTAAPGGKSTQLAALMDNDGFILANELNGIRAERLKFNVERQGASMVEVRVGDGKRLEEQWGSFFDAVLLDAPCSGVGLFALGNSQTYRYWSMRTVNQLANEQKKLLRTALWALKPGGTLVYSTCTLMRQENEAIVNWAAEKYAEFLTVEQVDLKITGAHTLEVRFENGGKGLTILPSELYEGFFVAKMRKVKELEPLG